MPSTSPTFRSPAPEAPALAAALGAITSDGRRELLAEPSQERASAERLEPHWIAAIEAATD